MSWRPVCRIDFRGTRIQSVSVAAGVGCERSWKLISTDQDVIDGGNSTTINDTDDFQGVEAILYSATAVEALVALKCADNPLTIRGRLSFEAHA